MSLVEEVALLRKIPLFAKLDPAKLKLLAFTSERLTFPAEQRLFSQGDPGDYAYVVIDGAADVLVDSPNGPVTVAHLEGNSLVGEMAIMCDGRRSASVVATSDLVTLRIAKETFLRMVNEFPDFAIEIIRDVAHKLEKTNEQLILAKDQLRLAKDQLRLAEGRPSLN